MTTSKEVIHEEIGATPVKVVNTEEDQEIDELNLIEEKHRDNIEYLLQSVTQAFRNPAQARRSKNYVKRQTFQLLRRTIELFRGDRQ